MSRGFLTKRAGVLRRSPSTSERNGSPCSMLNLWRKRTWLVVSHQARSFSSTNICAMSSFSQAQQEPRRGPAPARGLMETLRCISTDGCHMYANEKQIEFGVPSHQLSYQGSLPQQQKDCCYTANLSPQINYNEHINHHLFLVQRKISCFSSTSC